MLIFKIKWLNPLNLYYFERVWSVRVNYVGERIKKIIFHKVYFKLCRRSKLNIFKWLRYCGDQQQSGILSIAYHQRPAASFPSLRKLAKRFWWKIEVCFIETPVSVSILFPDSQSCAGFPGDFLFESSIAGFVLRMFLLYICWRRIMSNEVEYMKCISICWIS